VALECRNGRAGKDSPPSRQNGYERRGWRDVQADKRAEAATAQARPIRRDRDWPACEQAAFLNDQLSDFSIRSSRHFLAMGSV
jgi:hypothetical protein